MTRAEAEWQLRIGTGMVRKAQRRLEIKDEGDIDAPDILDPTGGPQSVDRAMELARGALDRIGELIANADATTKLLGVNVPFGSKVVMGETF